MPLRVAEKDGFIYAVNGCAYCPFIWLNVMWRCKHKEGKGQRVEQYNNRIPVWCPLPEPGRTIYSVETGIVADPNLEVNIIETKIKEEPE